MSKKEALNHLENSPDLVRKSAKSLRKRIRTTKNILVVACAFFFCWMPHTVLSIVTTFMYISCVPCLSAIPGELYIIFLMLGYSSSALNPYLYALRNRQFRNAFTRVASTLRCKLIQRHPSTRTSGNRQSSGLLRNQGGQSTATRTTTL